MLRTSILRAPAGYLDVGSCLLSDLSRWTSPAPHGSCWVLRGVLQASTSSPDLSTTQEGLTQVVSQRKLYFAFPCVWCKENIFCCFSDSPLGVTCSSLSSHWPVFPIQMVLDLQWLDSGLCDLTVFAAVISTVETASPPLPQLALPRRTPASPVLTLQSV